MKKNILIVFIILVLSFSMPATVYAHTPLSGVLILSIIFFFPTMLCFSILTYFIGGKLYKYSSHTNHVEYKFGRRIFIMFLASFLYPIVHTINARIIGLESIYQGLSEFLITFGFFIPAVMSVLLISSSAASWLVTKKGRYSKYALIFAMIISVIALGVLFISLSIIALIALLILLSIAHKMVLQREDALKYALAFAVINLCGFITAELVFQIIYWYAESLV